MEEEIPFWFWIFVGIFTVIVIVCLCSVCCCWYFQKFETESESIELHDIEQGNGGQFLPQKELTNHKKSVDNINVR